MEYDRIVKTIDIQDLPTPIAEWLNSLELREEVLISYQDRIVARLVAEPLKTVPNLPDAPVDWSTSAAFTRDRTGERVLTAEESQAILDESRGSW